MSSELDQYDYELPSELIAQKPLHCRSDARLMVVNRQDDSIEHHHVRDLPQILRRGDRLVVNDTKVIPAALAGFRSNTGGKWQGLFLEATEEGFWRLLSRTRGKLTAGEEIVLVDNGSGRDLRLTMVTKLEDASWIAVPSDEADPFKLLEDVGQVPLPHYIRGGKMTDADRETYQTVYASQRGAVAAPTAGLHFTNDLITKLETGGIGTTKLTLHVGLGTFRPITAATLAEHQMHREWCELSEAAATELKQARKSGGRLVAVGTTAVRTLESTAASGANLSEFRGETDLFIRPPYEFQAVDVLMTNFHLPRTSLLVLVRTFGGDDLMRAAYEEAIREEYRFYSYGDAMLIM